MKNKLSIIIAHYYPAEAHYTNPLIKTLNSINDDYHEDDIEIINSAIRATYNGPITLPFLRRNEVMFRIIWIKK